MASTKLVFDEPRRREIETRPRSGVVAAWRRAEVVEIDDYSTGELRHAEKWSSRPSEAMELGRRVDVADRGSPRINGRDLRQGPRICGRGLTQAVESRQRVEWCRGDAAAVQRGLNLSADFDPRRRSEGAGRGPWVRVGAVRGRCQDHFAHLSFGSNTGLSGRFGSSVKLL
ncbi:hypothetical protein F2Q68_00016064 [Brassica cretica]|uniref:Uncharacterized protein n=2 Tax=Brassica cretica TaxID=69181 RepID=A0A3N6U0G4_BRACR|nr:hypothetical protein F2Q68_00016064 [Brassica cretica]KAF3587523.1 hypothetical protein F2Q69_00029905 [Brassica cretica]KAF3608374.1 hypothetical protein DY000_02048598 [Brassica cretica]